MISKAVLKALEAMARGEGKPLPRRLRQKLQALGFERPEDPTLADRLHAQNLLQAEARGGLEAWPTSRAQALKQGFRNEKLARVEYPPQFWVRSLEGVVRLGAKTLDLGEEGIFLALRPEALPLVRHPELVLVENLEVFLRFERFRYRPSPGALILYRGDRRTRTPGLPPLTQPVSVAPDLDPEGLWMAYQTLRGGRLLLPPLEEARADLETFGRPDLFLKQEARLAHLPRVDHPVAPYRALLEEMRRGVPQEAWLT